MLSHFFQIIFSTIKEEYSKDVIEKEKKEIEFWKTSPTEGPLVFTMENIVNKMWEARLFLNKFEKYKQYFADSQIIIELGGGQGWGSCMLKKLLNKQVTVINSDIAKYALQSSHMWERLFEVKIYNVACISYNIPVKDNSIDLVFTYQVAHHFIKHNTTLN